MEENKKRYRTPRWLRLAILNTLKEVGGCIPDDYFNIRMLTAKIIHKYRRFVNYYDVWKYLRNSKSVEYRDGYWILKSLENEDENEG